MEDMASGGGEKNADEDFEVTYHQSESYEYVPITGVRGGYQPRGDVKLEFMLDHYPTPEREVYLLDDEGSIQSRKEEDVTTDLVREIKFAINVSPTNAFSIAVFTLSKILDIPQEEVEEGIEEQFAAEFEEDE